MIDPRMVEAVRSFPFWMLPVASKTADPWVRWCPSDHSAIFQRWLWWVRWCP